VNADAFVAHDDVAQAQYQCLCLVRGMFQWMVASLA
jgi:hypothetical protein